MACAAAAQGNAWRKEMQQAWQVVEQSFSADAILGPRGAQFVKSHSVRTSSHEFCVTMAILAGLAPLTNGATIDIFPGHCSLLNIMAVLVNYPQTRKSQLTKLVKTMGDELDAHVKARARALVEDEEDEVDSGRGPSIESTGPCKIIFPWGCFSTALVPAAVFLHAGTVPSRQ